MAKKTRERQLAKSAAKRIEERRRGKRRRIVAAVAAGVVAAAAAIGAFVFLTRPDVVEPTCDPKAPGVVPARVERSSPPPMEIDPTKEYTAVMNTSCGQMSFRLFAKQTPIAVNNFISLVDRSWYAGMPFHRVAKSIDIIQNGDPLADGTGGPGYTIEDEFQTSPPLSVGALAMANTGQPNSAGSQFFIVTGEGYKNIPGDYTVFGKIVEGLDVAKKIETVPVEKDGETPTENIFLRRVFIEEKPAGATGE
ncbi:MAG: peptidylprolyl isomerase [Actinomycetota bacterium]